MTAPTPPSHRRRPRRLRPDAARGLHLLAGEGAVNEAPTPWTAREQSELIASAERRMPPRLIRSHLHRLGYPLRTRAAVRIRLGKLAVQTGTGFQPWSEAEISVLLTAYRTGRTLASVGHEIGRSLDAVKAQARRLGLAGSHRFPLGFRDPGRRSAILAVERGVS